MEGSVKEDNLEVIDLIEMVNQGQKSQIVDDTRPEKKSDLGNL